MADASGSHRTFCFFLFFHAMVLGLIAQYFPSQYAVHISAAVVTVLVLRAFSQGPRTSRERDLHGRVILITGGFTPLGVTLMQDLAQRGAHIIALTAEEVNSPRVAVLVDLIRSTTSNELVFAEECDLSDPQSIQRFCERFSAGDNKRIDALLFAHEYEHIGPWEVFSTGKSSDNAKEREVKALATFLLITLLLPVVLVAPAERDIRIINVVNRFYAAAAASPSIYFDFPSITKLSSSKSTGSRSSFLEEGVRALRTVILTRHLQRILDALPSAPPPQTDNSSSTVPVASSKFQKSNIVAVSVSPGISRSDTVSKLFNADWTLPTPHSTIGVFL